LPQLESENDHAVACFNWPVVVEARHV
jgi:hypothetical protein